MTSTQKKCPASAATDPGCVSPNLKGQEMNAHEDSTMLTRRQALAGIAAAPITVAALPASAMSPEDIDRRIGELAREISKLLPHHPIQGPGRRGWYVGVNELGYWFSAAPAPDPHDPIVDAVEAYWEGMALFDRHELDDSDEIDAYAEVTYEPPLAVLDGWDKPALTQAGAIAALRFAAEEGKVSWLPDGVNSMIKAALGYLESGRS